MRSKVESFLRLFRLMVVIQWRDRIQTSAFLIGITLQTALLSIAVCTQAAALKFPVLFDARLALITLSLYVLSTTLCLQFSYLINIFEQPSLIMPILKFAVLLLGFRLVPADWGPRPSLAFPSGWCRGDCNENGFSAFMDDPQKSDRSDGSGLLRP